MPITFTYDARVARYRNSNGQFYGAADVLAAVDGYLDNVTGQRSDALFELIRSGTINVKELQLAGEREIAKAHLNAAFAAKGGRAQLSQADYGRVGGTVRAELVHWRDKMAEIAAGAPLDGRVKQSMQSYIRAAAVTAQRVQGADMAARGFDKERNRLNDGLRTCSGGARPSCSDVSARGWQPLGSLPLRGQRACYFNCLCTFEFKNSQTGEVRR